MHEKHPDQKYLDFAQKWVDGTITEEEKAAYIEWLKQSDHDLPLEVEPTIASSREEHSQKILAEIQRRISLDSGNQQQQENTPDLHPGISQQQTYRQAPVKRISPRKIIAAAALVAGLIFSGYLVFFNRTQQEVVNSGVIIKEKATDVEAGSNGAVLKLANGKVIILDTASNGSLANQVLKNQEAIVFEAAASEGAMQFNTLTTPRARHQQVVLPDGSRIWLNAESSIRFPTSFTGITREIELTGEAYFEITPDKTKPFIVNMKQSTVTVLGTHFNVMAYADEPFIETTLLEGSVRFNSNDRQMLLSPGQQSKLSLKNELLLDRHPDLELVMAWRNGFQSFKNANLASILRNVRRWYDVDIQFDSDIPSDLTFSGEVPREVSLQQLLRALESKQLKFTLDAEKRQLSVSHDSAR